MEDGKARRGCPSRNRRAGFPERARDSHDGGFTRRSGPGRTWGNGCTLDQVGGVFPTKMKPAFQPSLFVFCLCLGGCGVPLAAEVTAASRGEPSPRPRLTEALRLKVERDRSGEPGEVAVKMDRFVVREARIPRAAPKEHERDGQFSITQGGYVLKRHGEKFSTEVGLWRHIDLIEDPRDQLRQSERIRMSFLRLSW